MSSPLIQRIELLNGEIIDMRRDAAHPLNPPHANCVRKLLRVFQAHLSSENYVIDSQNPLQLSDKSLLQPDLVILPYGKELLRAGHLQGLYVMLLIEVSDSTYDYDRHTKFKAYAKTGIPEYWIIHLKESQIEVYTEPTDETYTQHKVYKKAFRTSLGFSLDLDDLLSFRI